MPDAPVPPLPDPARIREIASLLDPLPRGLAPSIGDRAIWDGLAINEAVTKVRILALAHDFLREPIPELTDAAYLATRASGVYEGYAREAEQRRSRLTVFTLAEGLENSGRFLPPLNREVTAICAERIWVMPPHDFSRLNFEGVRLDNDLLSAMTAWALASADTILGEGLEPSVRQSIRGRIRQTVTGPFQAAIRGLRAPEWWALSVYNWNSVVHAGILGAALQLDTFSTDERAEMIAAAELAMPLYLSGFPADGYSPEGIGYWRYGFGHFALLAEAILAATRGRLSLYQSAAARLIATFPERFEMTRGKHFYPPFSDARFPEPRAPWLAHLLDCRYGFGDRAPRALVPEGDFAHGFFSTFLYGWGMILAFDPGLAPAWNPSQTPPPSLCATDWFAESQVLISRIPDQPQALSFAVKGGSNGGPHGHNDLGAFLVALGETPLIVDPGVLVYGPLSFGPNRFKNQIMGSYGHSVPLVAGQWQGPGKDFSARVIEHVSTDSTDRIVFDLTGAYSVPALRNLTRTMIFDRQGTGALTVIDRVAFDSPQPFGTALVTYGTASEASPTAWIIEFDAARLRVEIDATASPFVVTNELLRDESRLGKVRRLGIDLVSPATSAEFRLFITVAK